jgi:ubiquitin C-terminal hydrolase
MIYILHILQQIQIFADYYFTEQFINNLNKDSIKTTVSYELYKLLKASMTNDDIVITPTSFKKIIGEKDNTWNEHNHQDSQQFLNFLITTLEEETGTKVDFIPGNPMKSKMEISNFSILPILADCAWRNHQSKEYSPLKEMLTGMTLIQNKCSCCSNVSNIFEPFNTLQVSIPPTKDIIKEFTIEDCFEHMIKEEQFDKDNLYNCDLCGLKNKGFTSRQLWKTPKILIIHIKRFSVDNYGNKRKKLINNIKYPIYDLDISNYINDVSPYKNKSKYNLIGVNLHHEFSAFGIDAGHYTSIVKNRFDNNWYIFNDNKDLIKITKKEELQKNNAYLLFYYRND